MAEEVGFEPTEPFGPTVFKTVAINRSATPPKNKKPGLALWMRMVAPPRAKTA